MQWDWEIAFGFLKRNPKSKAILLDFCHEMLQIAEKKGAAFSPRFETVQADAQVLPLQNKCVEAVTIPMESVMLRIHLSVFMKSLEF